MIRHFISIILSGVLFNLNSQTVMKNIDQLSVISLKLELFKETTLLSLGTGFIIQHNSKYFLLTNWHVISGKDYYTGKNSDEKGRLPNSIKINYHSNNLGKWVSGIEDIVRDGKPLWHETQFDGKLTDIITLPLNNIPVNAKIYPLNLDFDKTDMLPSPGGTVFVIGYPFGYSLDGFPVWKTGHIASDPDIDANGFPAILIDATTRPGMSGSPVFIKSNSYIDKAGSNRYGPEAILFLGIYSAQQFDSELGYIWKPVVVRKLISEIK